MAGAPAARHDRPMTSPAIAIAAAHTVRADSLLLTRGRNQGDDVLAVAAGLLLDGALAGVLDVTGRRRLGIDLRRVRAAGTSPEPLLADLRRRIEAVSPDTPQGWLERAMVYAPDRVRDELLATGAVAPAAAGLLQIVRRRAFEVVDDAALAAARGRARAGLVAHGPREVALAGLLRETELFGRANGGPPSRREGRALDAAITELPVAAQAILATLAEIRRRNERVGGWYADD